MICLNEMSFWLRVYTLKKLAELAREIGWRLEAAYHDPLKGQAHRPGVSDFNIVPRLSHV